MEAHEEREYLALITCVLALQEAERIWGSDDLRALQAKARLFEVANALVTQRETDIEADRPALTVMDGGLRKQEEGRMPLAVFIPVDQMRPCEVVELTDEPARLADDLDRLIGGTAWGYQHEPDATLAARSVAAGGESNERASRYARSPIHGDAVLHGLPDSDGRLPDVPERFLDPNYAIGWVRPQRPPPQREDEFTRRI